MKGDGVLSFMDEVKELFKQYVDNGEAPNSAAARALKDARAEFNRV